MYALIIFLMFSAIMMMGFYVGVYTERCGAEEWKSDLIYKLIDKSLTKKERKDKIKEENGFDATYDKYIA